MVLTRLRSKEFRKALLAGIVKLQDSEEELNRINVFPIPDGDTGTNLSETFNGGIQVLTESGSLKLCEVIKRFSDSILFTAKGNAGTIMSQLFVGLQEALEGKETISTKEFADSLMHASKVVYDSLENPVEGTIITVIRDTAEFAQQIATSEPDFITFFKKLHSRAETSLNETPELLPRLKEKGVVDAGALGFVLLLRGIVEYIETGEIELTKKLPKETKRIIEEEQIEHRYCAEAVVKADGVDKKELAVILGALGSSILIAGAGGLFKIHIHTNWPQKVFNALKKKGTLLKQKIDDMIEMNLRAAKRKLGVIVDSTADVPLGLAHEFGINVIPLQIIVDGKTCLDGIDIDKKTMLDLLVEGKTKLSTSQPDPISIERTIREALSKSEKVLILTLSSQLSGTYNAIKLVASKFKNVYVLDSKTVSLGTTLLALRALEKFKEGYDIESLPRYLNNVNKKSFFILTLNTVKYLMRSGRISHLKGGFVEALGIKPVLVVNQEGILEHTTQAFGKNNAYRKITTTLKKKLNPQWTYDFGIAYAGETPYPAKLEAFLKNNFSVRHIIKSEVGPLLALHVGPGAYGVVSVPLF
ncbi:MAG: DegV family EDD domain-containing protein [Candidatus Hydrothermae bacterium]|mgnify:FL=1|nr:DegV family EDD domain-containing protein [Candidatus Hydrothermae bacterium]MDD3649217.1 DegV family protein [Candidatus Hydrothermia bacterium]MDD5572421.1 DegV family protein [Candidatus Hydrothermia bacterium]HOL23341.1 DegV family protein [Candidatus Hydrothermia bacterium]HPO78476.1 DegV family protein [Candidatus Hydrothermia bacterium]